MRTEQNESRDLPPLPLENLEAIDAAVFNMFQAVRSLQNLARDKIDRLEALRSDPDARAEIEAALRAHQANARRLIGELTDLSVSDLSVSKR